MTDTLQRLADIIEEAADKAGTWAHECMTPRMALAAARAVIDNDTNAWMSCFEHPEHPGWYQMICAPIALQIDITDGTNTAHRCRLVDGKWIGAGSIVPGYGTYWCLSSFGSDEPDADDQHPQSAEGGAFTYT